MIAFHRLAPEHKDRYKEYMQNEAERGCEYSFANLYLWGRQHIAFVHDCAGVFSHFYGRSVYPFPIGPGDKKAVIEAYIHDAHKRGIPCRVTGLTAADMEALERWFPGRFHFR